MRTTRTDEVLDELSARAAHAGLSIPFPLRRCRDLEGAQTGAQFDDERGCVRAPEDDDKDTAAAAVCAALEAWADARALDVQDGRALATAFLSEAGLDDDRCAPTTARPGDFDALAAELEKAADAKRAGKGKGSAAVVDKSKPPKKKPEPEPKPAAARSSTADAPQGAPRSRDVDERGATGDGHADRGSTGDDDKPRVKVGNGDVPAPPTVRERVIGGWSMNEEGHELEFRFCSNGDLRIAFDGELAPKKGGWAVEEGDPPKLKLTSAGGANDTTLAVTTLEDDHMVLEGDEGGAFSKLDLRRKSKDPSCD